MANLTGLFGQPLTSVKSTIKITAMRINMDLFLNMQTGIYICRNEKTNPHFLSPFHFGKLICAGVAMVGTGRSCYFK
jgi:hypothetical protein